MFNFNKSLKIACISGLFFTEGFYLCNKTDTFLSFSLHTMRKFITTVLQLTVFVFCISCGSKRDSEKVAYHLSQPRNLEL
jgi:hypothetical protein